MSFDAFYEAFHSCSETAQAIAVGKVSTELRNLKTFTLPPKQHEQPFQLPYPFPNLLHLQSFNGKWTNLELVLKCLHLPPNVCIPNTEEWQQATAFAVAFIRQRYDLFEHLGDAHDKAAQWITSEYVTAARDIINDFDPDYITKPLSLFTLTTMPSTITLSPQNTIEVSPSEDAPDDITVDTIDTSQTNMSAALLSALGPSIDLTALNNKIDSVSHQILLYQNEVIRHAIALDERYKNLLQCYHRCAHCYNTAVTHKERNAAFDEFTALLGADRAARPGFEGWRGRKLLGYRTCVMDVLRNIHYMATQKLLLQQLILLQQRSSANESVASVTTTLAVDVEDNWTVIWNNEDLVMHVLSSLNVLSRLPVLRQWYGESFPYGSNPMSLPIALDELSERIAPYNKFLNYCTSVAKHQAKASLQENTSPTSSTTTEDNILRRQERTYRNEIIAFQELMQLELRDFPSWWPAIPDIIDMQQTEYLYISLLVLRIKTATFEEKKAAVAQAEAAARPKSKVGTQLPPKKGSLMAGILGLPSATAVPATNVTTRSLRSRQAPESFKQWLFTYDYIPNDQQHQQQPVPSRKKSKVKLSRGKKKEDKPLSAPATPASPQHDELGPSSEPVMHIPIRAFDEDDDIITANHNNDEAAMPVASTPPVVVSPKSQASQVNQAAAEERRPSLVSHVSATSNVSKLTEKSNATVATKTSKHNDSKPILANIEYKQTAKPPATTTAPKSPKKTEKRHKTKASPTHDLPIKKSNVVASSSPVKPALSTKFPKKKKPSHFLSATATADVTTSLPSIKPRVVRASFPTDKKMTRRAKTAPKLQLDKEKGGKLL